MRGGSRLRLLLVSQYFWPESFPINVLMRALRERGVEVTVITGQPNYPEGEVFAGYSAWRLQRGDFDGMEVLRVPLFPRGKRSPVRLAVNYLSFVFAGLLFGPWLLRGRDFDVVFVYAPSPLLQALPAIWLARLKRAPCVLWVQDLWPESLSATGFVKNKTVLRLVESVVRYIYRHTDRVLIPSEAFRMPINRLLDDPTRIRYYPNAYAGYAEALPDDWKNIPGVRALTEDIRSGFSIVFAGNLGTAQSLETIIGAATMLQQEAAPIRFFLIGSGSLSDWLSDEISQRALRNVVLPGRFPPEAMPGFYGAAEVLLMSLRDEPIFAFTIPSKMQGYLAAGKPVIASLNGEGARVVVEAGAGLACPAADARSLAQAALELYRLSADARRKMGDNARRYALEHFTLDHLTTELVSQFEELAATEREKRW